MEFKQLHLLRDRISITIRNFNTEISVEETIKDKTLTIYKFRADGQDESQLNVYYDKKGRTTLLPDPNKNPELSTEIAVDIVNNCSIKGLDKRTFYFRNLPEDHFEVLIEFLKDYDATIENGKNLILGTQIKVSSPHGDSIFINRYKNGATQIQGNNCLVKAWALEGLVGLLPYEELVEAQLATLEIKESASEIIAEFEQMLPNASKGLDPIYTVVMSSSVAARHINIDLPDYSMFVNPALRGLEGYLKSLFKESGIIIGSEGFSRYFEFPDGVTPVLSSSFNNFFKLPSVREAVENIYRYFHKHRHSLAHMDVNVQMTRIIEKREDAVEMVEEIFQMIEDTYSKLK
ncbi:type II toxin-antitoxin system RnlA family toxin [Dyadobacter sp. CY107]|uniref:type II toxin-antitoxin system RnlA family toxin n=1 Tax=Dyadobacter fanqingshengii TaxID=2906443 RepID=UPI001F17EB82|nr:type II toxin-antitoxin system RnlA family toxin [Dyadobacter fanqingshengii]MCF2502579.1 type II toxin-antitoxin system RnlA family toxin [Dyadobacter fanqingshengii]